MLSGVLQRVGGQRLRMALVSSRPQPLSSLLRARVGRPGGLVSSTARAPDAAACAPPGCRARAALGGTASTRGAARRTGARSLGSSSSEPNSTSDVLITVGRLVVLAPRRRWPRLASASCSTSSMSSSATSSTGLRRPPATSSSTGGRPPHVPRDLSTRPATRSVNDSTCRVATASAAPFPASSEATPSARRSGATVPARRPGASYPGRVTRPAHPPASRGRPGEHQRQLHLLRPAQEVATGHAESYPCSTLHDVSVRLSCPAEQQATALVPLRVTPKGHSSTRPDVARSGKRRSDQDLHRLDQHHTPVRPRRHRGGLRTTQIPNVLLSAEIHNIHITSNRKGMFAFRRCGNSPDADNEAGDPSYREFRRTSSPRSGVRRSFPRRSGAGGTLTGTGHAPRVGGPRDRQPNTPLGGHEGR